MADPIARVRNAIVLGALATLVVACAVGPDYREPAMPARAAFVAAAEGPYEPAATGTALPDAFWSQFHDATLDGLVHDAQLANHDLRIAWGRLQSARALARLPAFDLAPTVTANGGYTRQRLAAVQSPTGAAELGSYYNAQLDASWELDLFGRVRRERESSRARVGASDAALRDAQVSVTAAVVLAYFELRGAQVQLQVARRNVDNQRATVELTQARLDAGSVTELDTARAREQLSATLAIIGPLESAAARARHALAVLTGRDPVALDELLAATVPLPMLPGRIEIGDPATLLRRRPDVRAAERSLAAATATIGVATADLFPRVTLGGDIGYAAAASGDLGNAATRTWLVGPALHWSAFDLGRVRARIGSARADAGVALARYEQAVLHALQESEDALVTHARLRESAAHATQAAEESRHVVELARARYAGGMTDFLTVLDAERTELEAERNRVQTDTEAALSLVRVYKALGAGWQAAPAPQDPPAAAVRRAQPPAGG